MPIPKGPNCFGDVMGEFKRGELHSGKDGPRVKSKNQAKAIAASMCNNSEDAEADFGCGCSHTEDKMKRKKSMMALGYSEEAIDKVLMSEAPVDFSEDDKLEMAMSRLKVMNGRIRELMMVLAAAKASNMPIDAEQWALDKLVLAADYISAAADNMKYGDALEIDDDAPYGEKKGLWANIHAKRERIKRGSGERMRKPGEKGAPSEKDLKDSQSKD